MAEVTGLGIKNLEAGQDACTKMQEACQKIDDARAEAGKAYSILTTVNPDLGSGFINNLVSSLEEIYNFLNQTIIPGAQAYFKEDEPTEPTDDPKQDPDPAGPGGTSGGGTSGGGSSGGGPYQPPGGDPTPAPTPEPAPEPEPIPDPESPVPSLEEMDLTPLEETSLGDIKGLTDQLIELSKQENKKIDELLEDKEKSDLLKALLLESPNIPQEFKDVIEKLESNVVRILLDYILKGNRPEVFDLNSLNIGIVYEYLRQVAEQNGISIEDLLKNPLYTQLLRDTLTSFDEVIELIKGWDELVPEEFQVQLKDFYLGNVSEEFPDEDILVTRAFVDYLADECDVSYEELINDSTYAETLKEGALQFGKSLTFFNFSGFFTDEGMRNNVTSMFNGTNYKAYGMDKESVESFKTEIDNLASENNTTSDELLSNQVYADQVKDALANSSSAKGVGSIFKNVDSTVSQEVAKNLYNTSFEESPQQQELDEYYAQILKLEEEAKQAEVAAQQESSALTSEEKQQKAEEARAKAEEYAKQAAEEAKERASREAEVKAKEKSKDAS